jgi:serine/threonine protein kinase
MGVVYRARDPQLEREVAIKVLGRASAAAVADLSANDTIDLRATASPRSQDDLLREARLMAQVSHPNVLPVYEAGLADGAVFVVMELIDGRDLASWLSEPRTPARSSTCSRRRPRASRRRTTAASCIATSSRTTC